jgi:hypothetical protein
MTIKKAVCVGILGIGAITPAEERLAGRLLSTGKFWEARLVFIQYGDVAKKVNAPPQVLLKGNTPSSAVVLGVQCTALTDRETDSKTSDPVSSIPSVYVDHSGLDRVSVMIEHSPGGPRFTEMAVYQIFGEGSPSTETSS